MLVLTRKPNQSIIIADNIIIKVVEVNEGNVKIGIDAPKNIPVFREEIYKEIQEENRRAAATPKEFNIEGIKFLEIF